MPREPQRPTQRLRTIEAVASSLGLAPKTLWNRLYKHRDYFRPRRYRGRYRVLTDSEVDALAHLFEVRVK